MARQSEPVVNGAPLSLHDGQATDLNDALALPIRVILVDDHPVYRAGVRSCLSNTLGIEILADVSDGASGMEYVGEHGLDVAIVDAMLRDADGVDTSLRFRDRNPSIGIVLVSECFDVQTVYRALQAGILGFLHKRDSLSSLTRAIRVVSSGLPYRSDSLENLLEIDAEGCLTLTKEAACWQELSVRERAVLMLLTEGSSLKQMAHRLGISYKAADHIKQTLMRKLGIHDRVMLTRMALQFGLNDRDQLNELCNSNGDGICP